MLKRIAMSLATIAAVAVLAIGATGAYFSDEERILGNTVATGTLELAVDHGENKPWDISNFAPGYATPWEWASVTNTGSIGGNLTVTAQQTGGSTDLYDALNIEVRLNNSGGPVLYNGPVNGLSIAAFLNAGQTRMAVQRIYLPDNGQDQNYLQGLSTTFDEVFYIQQPGI